MNFKFILALLFSSTCVISNSVAENCSRDQAFNKMMAIGKAASSMMAAGGQSTQQAVLVQMEVSDVGQTLADGEYKEACSRYNQIAIKYGIDLEKESKGMVTMDQIRKDGGKKGGSCSQADATKKVVELHQSLADKVALGDMTQSESSAIIQKTEKLNPLIYSDPSKVCDELAKITKENKI